MSTKLTLAIGSHAGIEEPLKHGFYMIGRDRECQIRPKSHSVSRRHCLLHHSGQGLRVFDLASANGTRVNDQRLEPNQWMWLKTGDTLRCGKVAFDVCVEPGDETSGPPLTSESLKAAKDSPVNKNRAWEDFDIVSFLEAEDEAERQQRYSSLRSHVRGKGAPAESVSDQSASRTCEITSIDLVQGDKEAQAVLREARERARRKAEGKSNADVELSPRARRIATIHAKIQADRVKADLDDAIKRTLGRRPHTVKGALPVSSSSGRRARTVSAEPSSHEPGHMKLCAAVFLATFTGCYLLYSAYRVGVGTPRYVIEGID